MKKTFKEYYSLSTTEKNKLWKDAIFIFDANILLNLYKYSTETRNEFLNILEKMGNRIWLPHQFALEYQRKRLKIIEDQSIFYKNTSEKLSRGFASISNEIKKDQQQHPFLNIDNLLSKISKSIEIVIKEIEKTEKKHPDWFNSDPIRNKIDSLLRVKWDPPCEDIQSIENKGSARISKEIPPGYKDIKKNYPYGDWIGWYQIMEMVKTLEDKKPIIFVTNDNKEDWWLKINKKTIGPKPELIKEISEHGVKFHMYTMEIFLKIATPIYKVKKATVKEIGDINKKEINNIQEDLSDSIPPASGTESSNPEEGASKQHSTK